ncbi:hypothetical protein BKA61DRAFT_731416 [Leptodontidium sp. MPI-SDFR-AT-0119]|nr:hypothetical protein BKA61DRAFT_731416 [Leptodontidium sp. MPI-SDFR-AT-0119]
MAAPVVVPPAAPAMIQPAPANSTMGVVVEPSNTGDAPSTPITDDFTLALTTQLATDIMLDRQLKPKKTQFRYNDLPPRSSFISKSIEDLKHTHRISIFKQFQLLEKTFGPEVSSYKTPRMFITWFERECKRIEATCVTSIGMSQTMIFSQLENHYTKFGKSLDMLYDGFLTCELKARYDLEMKNLGRQKPKTYPFHFFKGALYMHTNNSGGHLEHYPIALFPIPAMTLCQRLLDEAFRTRSGHTDRFEIFRILTKEVKRRSIDNTLQMERMIEALENKYRSSVFAKLCANIDKQAKIIIRRFGIDYFFTEDQEFGLFLRHWAQRYCNVAEKEFVDPERLAQEVGKVLYALLEFLKVSHDALLERVVEAKLLATIDLLSKGGMTVTPAIDKFTVRRANIDLVDVTDSDSREKLVICINNNELSYATGELDEDLQISSSDLTLPFDNMLFKTKDEDEESDNSDSEDEMFPPLRDHLLHPIWHTRPKEKLQKCVKPRASKATSLLFGSIVSSVAFPSLSASQQRTKAVDSSSEGQNARSIAASLGSSTQARATAVRGSSPISSPARPVTPASKSRLQAVNKNDQTNGIKGQRSPTKVTKRQQSRSPTKWTKELGDKMSRIDLRSSPIDRKAPSMNGAAQRLGPPGTALCPSASTNGSQSNGTCPVEKDETDPQSRLNKWLNDPAVSATASIPTAQRPGEPFFAPSPDVAAHVRNIAAEKKNKQPPQAQPRHRTHEEAYQASKQGTLARQQASETLGTDLGMHPKWPASVSGVKKPQEDTWSSEPMPPPEELNSWDEWSLEWSERRRNGYKLTDKEFNDEIDRSYK